ncbi:hypothetical protein V6R21_08915 [Limibacter armeniacum]|uniref:hypothetical protein n=1 Tax=Limibacter armeniacum TaxID=466084 RepID=UPI002FE586CD
MNKDKATKLLKKVYHYSNSDHDNHEVFKTFGIVPYKTGFLSDQDYQTLKNADLLPNDIQHYTHDQIVDRLLEIKQKITLEFAASLFLKGLSGELRFRQTLMSYWFVKNLVKHEFNPASNFENENFCTCGLPKSKSVDRTHTLFTYHLGHSWNESPISFLFELEEILTCHPVQVTQEDSDLLINLLAAINNAPKDETPSQLANRIGKEKLLPKTDKYKRYGILQTLAVTGILPNKNKLDNQHVRSDIVMPLAGWNGELGVDYKKAEEIFKITFPSNH